MANVKITELSSATTLGSSDVFPVVDVGATETKKVTVTDLLRNTPDGTAGAPSIANAGDQDTGIYFPAENNVGVSTGGTQRLVITSGGYVGLGTGSPSAPLDVETSNDVVIEAKSTDRYAHIDLIDNASSSRFTTDGNSGTLRLRADTGNAVSGSRIQFEVDGSEKARLDSDGRLGIGTTSPDGLLTVRPSSGNSQVFIRTNDTTSRSQIIFSDSADSNVGGVQYDHSDDSLQLHVGNRGEKARLDEAGKLFVGTTSALGNSVSDLLHLQTTTGGAINLGRNDSSVSEGNLLGRVRFYSNAGSNQEAARISAAADGTHADDDKPGRLEFYTTADNSAVPTERMRIDSSGNIGIGTSSPDRVFEIQNSAPIIRLTESAGTYSEISANTSVLSLRADEGNGVANTRIDFRIDGSEVARIDSSGNVGIGTSSPGSKVHVNDPGTGLAFSNAAGGNFNIGLLAGTASPSGYIFQRANSSLLFGTNNTERMRISHVGRLSVISASTQAVRINSTSAAGATNYILYGAYSASSISDGTQSFGVYTNGNVVNTNNSYGAISDAKLKENIVDADSQWNDIKDLRVRNYNFIEGQTHTQIGVVAQEVETVSPGLVSESPDIDNDGNDLGTVTKSVNYSVLYMKAVKALQEAMERIETLETKVAALEAQ